MSRRFSSCRSRKPCPVIARYTHECLPPRTILATIARHVSTAPCCGRGDFGNQKRGRREATHGSDQKICGEAVGTFWLTFAGCGSAVIAAAFRLSDRALGVSLAFGLTVVTMAYAIGHVSGCHLNPAVTIGLAAGGRFPTGQIVPYIIAQVAGAIVAAGVTMSSRAARRDLMSPKGLRPMVAGNIRPACTASAARDRSGDDRGFLFIHHGRDARQGAGGLSPLAIGLGLTLIHLVSIPVTNTSVNPARSTGPALFVGDWALGQSSGCSGSRRSSAVGAHSAG